MLTLARQARERGWWRTYSDAVPEWFEVYLSLEAEASVIHDYAAELVPGCCRPPTTTGHSCALHLALVTRTRSSARPRCGLPGRSD